MIERFALEAFHFVGSNKTVGDRPPFILYLYLIPTYNLTDLKAIQHLKANEDDDNYIEFFLSLKMYELFAALKAPSQTWLIIVVLYTPTSQAYVVMLNSEVYLI